MTYRHADTAISPLAWVMILALALLWGGSFFFVGVAVAELPPLTIVLVRVCLAALALLSLLLVVGIAIPGSGRTWCAFLVMGLLNNAVPFALIVWGQTHIASGLASILNATTPLFVVIVAHFLTADEKITARKLAGVALGIAGVAVLMGDDALSGLGMTDLWAQLAVTGAALSYAFAGVYGRRFARMGLAPLQTAAGQLTCSTAVLLPLALFVEQPWQLPLPSSTTFAALVALALCSTALAYFLYFRILDLAGATNLLLVTFLIPPTAIALGALFLGEALLAAHLTGFGLILAGLAVIDGRALRTLDRRLVRRRHS